MGARFRSWMASRGAGVARAGVLALPVAFVVLALVEALWPLAVVRARPGIVPSLVAQMVVFAARALFGAAIYMAGVCVVEGGLAAFAPARPRARWIAHAVLAIGLSVHAYLTLLRYAVFKEHPILVAPYVGACVMIAAIGIALTSERWRRRAAYVALGAGAAIHVANHAVLADSYFTFHLSVMILALALLFLGLTGLLVGSTRPWIARGLAIASVVVLGAGFLAAKTVAVAARPQALLHTLLGRLQVVFAPFTEGSEGPPVPRQIDPDGVARFRSRSGLPELPPDFRLGDYNVVYITSEAVRFDKTSLADRNAKTTPNLRALVDGGAFSFTQAHSPSSATLSSNAATMAMTYPSATRLDAWSRSWCGELSQDETTVAELMKQAGYATFRVSHDFHFGFSENLLGFDQGFDENDLFVEATEKDGLALDRRIADRTAERIAQHAGGRFFGWVYFASPHEPYYARYPDMPAATDADRYAQELRAMDEAVGVVVDALRKANVFDKTIIVFVADHGEELGDHGGKGHKTLYSECTHVPFVVRIPGITGAESNATTSTLYGFPWLLLHGEGAMREAAERRAREDLGPMIRATDGAVVAELVAYDKMQSVLIWPDRRVVYNFVADATSAYDLARDPGQQRDLVVEDPSSIEGMLAAVRAYRDVRRGMHRYTLDPEKKPSHARLRKEKREQKAAEP